MHSRTFIFVVVGITLLADSGFGSSIWKDERWARRASQDDDDYAEDADDSMPAEYGGDPDYDDGNGAAAGGQGREGGAKPAVQRKGGATGVVAKPPAVQGGGATGVVAKPADKGEGGGAKSVVQRGGGVTGPNTASQARGGAKTPAAPKLQSSNRVMQAPPPGRAGADSPSSALHRQPHKPSASKILVTAPTTTTAKAPPTTTTTRKPRVESRNKPWHHRALEKIRHAGRQVGNWFRRGWDSVFGDEDLRNVRRAYY